MKTLKQIAQAKNDEFLIALENIVFHPWANPREDFSHVPDLAASMVAVGQLDPIEVRPDEDGERAEGVHGESRYRAAKYANEHLGGTITALRCVVAPTDLKALDIVLRHFHRGNNSKPLTALECAGVYDELHNSAGMTVTAISAAVNRSESHIYDHLKLFELPEFILNAVRSGLISASAAIEIAKAPEGKRQKLIDKIMAQLGESEEKDLEDGEDDGEPRERITKAAVETELNGHPKTISAAAIRDYIQRSYERIKASKRGSKELERWEGVKYGLETALGLHDDDWKSGEQ